MGQKMNFVERAAKGEPVAALCREFGVSRQTGHKWVRRFREQGFDGLEDRSRRPASAPLATAEDVVLGVLRERKRHPTWGPRKLAVVLARALGSAAPSERTVARILKRAELVRARRKRRPANLVERAPAVSATHPNDVWTIDFKGWWLTRDGRRANPLTVRDAFSRFVLSSVLCPATTEAVRAELLRLFKKHGTPGKMQMDNGTPFISVRSVGGLSVLSAWLMSLGITIVRSRPGAPQDNGAHERMHRDMSAEVEALPADNAAEQQKVLDRWRQDFNSVRPHAALGGRTPREVYTPRERRPPVVRAYGYTPGLELCRVFTNGDICFQGQRYFVSMGMVGHEVALERMTPTKARLWFRDVELSILDVDPDVSDAVYESELAESAPLVRKGAA